MKRTLVGFSLTLTLSLGLIVIFLLLAVSMPTPVLAQGGTGTVRVSRNHPNTQNNPGCGSVVSPCKTIQYGIDQAQAGDEVLVAQGLYDDGVNDYDFTDQAVYISKTLALRGGYTDTNWAAPDPDLHPTIIDAQDQGRVLKVEGDISVTVEGFELTGGNANFQRGSLWNLDDCGGGVHVASTLFTMNNCRIVGNTASTQRPGRGGGIYLRSSTAVTLTGNTIMSNTAATGATDYGAGGGGHSREVGSVTLEANTIKSNTSSQRGFGYGGGWYHFKGDLRLTANDIVSNAAGTNDSGMGGGLIIYYAKATLEGNKILGNKAAASALSMGTAGGIRIGENSVVTMSNNLIADNRGPTESDGLLIVSGGGSIDAYMMHNTIADNGNHEDAQGIYVGGFVELIMTDTIISGHRGAGLYVEDGPTVALEATLWYSNGENISGSGAVTTGTIALEGDPAFVDPASWDYHLTAGSAAIDAGIDAGVGDDLDGVPRPALAGFDIGAYEFPYAVAFTPDRTGVGQPGDVVTYTHTLTNLGAVTDAFAFSHSSDQGFTVTYASPVTVGAGDSQTLVISVQVPTDAVSGTLDTTVLTATSQGGPWVMASVEDVTQVKAGKAKVYLPVVIKNQ